MGVFDELKARVEEKKTKNINEKDNKKRVKASKNYMEDKEEKDLLNDVIGEGQGHRPYEMMEAQKATEEMSKVQKRIKGYKNSVQEMHDDDEYVGTLIEKESEIKDSEYYSMWSQPVNAALAYRVNIEAGKPTKTMSGYNNCSILLTQQEYEHMYQRPLGSMIYNTTRNEQKNPEGAEHAYTLTFEHGNVFRKDFVDEISKNPNYLKSLSVFDLKCVLAYGDGEFLNNIGSGVKDAIEEKYKRLDTIEKSKVSKSDIASQKIELNTMLGYADVLESSAEKFAEASLEK